MSQEVPQPAAGMGAIHKRVVLFTAALAALSTLEYWLIFTWEGVTPADKVSAVLAIIGVYGTALGLLRRSQGLKDEVKDLIPELTSPNAALCWGSNAVMLSIPLNLLSLSLSSRRRFRQPLALALPGTLASLAMSLVLAAYVFFHALVVVPIAYPALLVAAAVVNAIDASAEDMRFGSTDRNGTASPGVSLKEVVLSDRPAATAFIMGVPAAAFALIGRVFAPFLG